MGQCAYAVCPASSAFPGVSHESSLKLVMRMGDPWFGPFDMRHMQLCPQHTSLVSEEKIDALAQMSPQTLFRLHASVRVTGAGEHRIWDASNAHVSESAPYWRRVKELTRHSGAGVYSLHAGRSENADLAQVRTNVLRLQDEFGFPVALEGLYPESGKWLLADWDDYEWLLGSDLCFALDLSHLNIVARRCKRQESELVRELLSSDRCLEVHVSGNNGIRDEHSILTAAPWWESLMVNIHPNAAIFNESTVLTPKQAALLLHGKRG